MLVDRKAAWLTQNISCSDKYLERTIFLTFKSGLLLDAELVGVVVSHVYTPSA